MTKTTGDIREMYVLGRVACGDDLDAALADFNAWHTEHDKNLVRTSVRSLLTDARDHLTRRT